MNHRRLFAISAAMGLAIAAHADEGGVSFWLPGQQSNFAATPGEPGWSIPVVYYHTSSDAGLSREFVVGGNLVAGLEAEADLFFAAPTYTFASSVMGGQGSVTLTVAGGHMRVDADATLTGPGGNPISVNQSVAHRHGGPLSHRHGEMEQGRAQLDGVRRGRNSGRRLRRGRAGQSRLQSLLARRRRWLYVSRCRERPRVLRRRRLDLQLRERRHQLPKRSRWPHRLGLVAVPERGVARWPGRVRLLPTVRRQRRGCGAWRLQSAYLCGRTASRVLLSGGQEQGLCQSARLF